MKIKVLIVDDSAFMRKVLTDIINDSDTMEVVGAAKNGEDAIEKIRNLKPDVVTMDVEMPVMDGLTALERIMAETPLPVVMLSSYTKEGADATLRALELGAIDFISKPSSIFKVNTEDIIKEINEKVTIASKAKFRSKTMKITPRPVEQKVERPSSERSRRRGTRIDKVIAIGTSTGGPKALQEVVPKLPGDLNASVIIVQHMPPKFTKSLAERLDSMSEFSVKEAEDREMLKPGFAYIAPGDQHLKLKKIGTDYQIMLTKEPPVSGHRPSADAMFYSLADLGLFNIIGVIMTGMGADGAKGLERIKHETNGFIIAQNEESCVVYGMPKSTVKLGVVDKECDLLQISSEIVKAMGV
ncbi:MAG: chemotaxis response regulator protein-glutamate methylesterase [Clostridia bacterium]|nr:chemotaxis response regulator protein-glutamate methylesterase [Clostridia bacterium]